MGGREGDIATRAVGRRGNNRPVEPVLFDQPLFGYYNPRCVPVLQFLRNDLTPSLPQCAYLSLKIRGPGQLHRFHLGRLGASRLGDVASPSACFICDCAVRVAISTPMPCATGPTCRRCPWSSPRRSATAGLLAASELDQWPGFGWKTASAAQRPWKLRRGQMPGPGPKVGHRPQRHP